MLLKGPDSHDVSCSSKKQIACQGLCGNIESNPLIQFSRIVCTCDIIEEKPRWNLVSTPSHLGISNSSKWCDSRRCKSGSQLKPQILYTSAPCWLGCREGDSQSRLWILQRPSSRRSCYTNWQEEKLHGSSDGWRMFQTPTCDSERTRQLGHRAGQGGWLGELEDQRSCKSVERSIEHRVDNQWPQVLEEEKCLVCNLRPQILEHNLWGFIAEIVF